MAKTFIKFPTQREIIFPRIIRHGTLIIGRYYIRGEKKKKANSMKYSLWECSTNYGNKL